MEDAEKEHERLVQEEEADDEAEKEKEEEAQRTRDIKMREARQDKEHEDLLKQLSQSSDVQLV